MSDAVYKEDWKPGDKVKVVDYSAAHGMEGVVWDVTPHDIIIVELGDCLWPVTRPRDLVPA